MDKEEVLQEISIELIVMINRLKQIISEDEKELIREIIRQLYIAQIAISLIYAYKQRKEMIDDKEILNSATKLADELMQYL